MSFWTLLEVFRDQNLLTQVRQEVSETIIHDDESDKPQLPLRFSIEALTSGPLLQSVYAEILRMRMSVMLSRSPAQGDYRLGPYLLEHNAYVFISTNVAHENEAAWAAHTDHGRRPLTEFWAERFLVPVLGANDTTDEKKKAREQEKREFSTKGLEGAWIPYGGGALMCPGRHLAKKEMMGGVAVFAAYFDLELLRETLPRMKHEFYGLGAQPPAEKTPVRIRRRIGLANQR
jgi:cytochrome P450